MEGLVGLGMGLRISWGFIVVWYKELKDGGFWSGMVFWRLRNTCLELILFSFP